MAAKLGGHRRPRPLPRQVIDAAQRAGREVFVLAFEGETEPATVAGVPHRWVPLGAVGRALAALREAGSEEVVLIGPVRRPSFAKLKLDWRGMQLVGKARPARRARATTGCSGAIVARARGRGLPRDRRRRGRRQPARARRAC